MTGPVVPAQNTPNGRAQTGLVAPDLLQAEQPRRAADWYELFFDLVFVAVIAVSADLIEGDPQLSTVVLFVLLFSPLWWAWVNLMVTNNLYGTRFPAIGALVIAAMPGAAAMAIAISGSITNYGWLYAAGAAYIRLVLLVMWLIPYVTRVAVVRLWRPLAYNLGTAVLWLISIGVAAPGRYWLWALAVAAEVFLLAFHPGGLANEIYDRAVVSHLLERVGLFVVIVIGEAVYLSVTGLVALPTIGGGAAALFGFLVCALLARAFFRWGAPTAERGLTAAQQAHSYGAMRDVVMYLPFVLVTALTLIAAAIGIAVVDASAPMGLSVRTLLACGIGGFYLANAAVGLRLGRPIGGIALLLVPALVLSAAACFLSGGLAAWATLALAALALVLLEVVSRMLSTRPGRVDSGLGPEPTTATS
ncbi:low temperature requirement protein A [Homoserinimonas sp. OAct 916]|uniref:low temperature requirement protein A n=1 Tax=Homoserinimonas sp. OAct 916 TaxID=2211450 RepID=UPI0013006B3F|nr:low temperature requirement protein A [Homoserinimonas sp. OAct 916]